MELHIFLNRSDMPMPTSWQQSIDDCGFTLRIDTDFDPLQFTGFLPCSLDDHQTGFEYYLWPKEEVAAPGTYLVPAVKDYDSVVTFVWDGNLREMIAVTMAAGALAASCFSVLHSPEDDSIVGGEKALGYAREQIAEARKFLR